MPRVSLKRSIGPVEKQLFDDFLVHIEVVWISCDAHDCNVQRSLSRAILGVDVRAIFDQELHIHELLLQDCKVQRRGLESVAHIDIVVALFSQNEDREVACVLLGCAVHHSQSFESHQAQIGLEVGHQCVNQRPVAQGHDLMHGTDLVLSESVLEQLLANLWSVLCQMGQVQYYVQSFLLNCEVKYVSIILEFDLSQVFKRYGQSIKRCNIIVRDGKD